MITIYSVNPETGALYTDEKQRFYIDAELLRERAIAIKTMHLLDRIASIAGYGSRESMITSLRCSGVTADVLDSWIMTGKLTELLEKLPA